MLNHEQLLQLINHQKDLYFTFGMADEWARFHTILDKDMIILEVQDFNYTPMYYLPLGEQPTPIIYSPVYHQKECPVSKYYLHQTNRLIKFLKGLMSPLETDICHLTVYTYCKYCKKRLTTFKSMLMGVGPECQKTWR